VTVNLILVGFGNVGQGLAEILNSHARSFKEKYGPSIKVSPEIIPLNDPLCVSSNLNAVVFECAYSGQHLIVGRGAGGKETASSIIRDIINVATASRNFDDRRNKDILRMPREIESPIRGLCN